MSSWVTVDRNDPLKPSLIERAKKRTTEPASTPGWFRVHGNSSLGDHYEVYDVHRRDDGTWYCTCQGNKGGEYRRVCSHMTGAALYIQKHGEDLWENTEGQEEGVAPEPEADTHGFMTGATDEPESHNHDTEISDADKAQWGKAIEQSREDEEAQRESRQQWEQESHDPDSESYDPFLLLDPDNPLSPSAFTEYGDGPPLPAKFEKFRQDQWRAICEVTEALDEGYKVVMVEAPTGAGKTLIAEAVRRLQRTQAIYTCTTKTLQDQIIRDFSDYARVLKGRSNYGTLNGDTDITADDCNREMASIPACTNCSGFASERGMSWADSDAGSSVEIPHCTWCHPVSRCPYNVAKKEATHAPLAVLNTAYLLAETNKSRGVFADWSLVLIDEADKLEDELMRFVEVSIGPYQRRDLGIGLPKKKTVDQAWVDWIYEEVIPAIEKKIRETIVKTGLDGLPDTKAGRKKRRYQQMLADVKGLILEVEDEETGKIKPVLQQGWVYTGYEGKEERYVTVTFKPVMVRDYAQRYLWNKANQFVLMSATLVSAEQVAFDLGLEDGEWTAVYVPSSFPKERRPIVIDAPVAVTRNTKEEAYPVLVSQVNEIMDKHRNERILVHSVSYDLTKEFYYKLDDRSRLHTYMNSGEREQSLERFLHDPRGVMIAPSFDRGVDLHGDDCRVIVVAKVPYPYLGDAQVKKRTYSTGRAGRIWYAVQTIRTLVQMTGRGMRSEDDWCKTYVLDRQFSKLYAENRRLFPSWWAEALVWDQNDPRWRVVLDEMEEWANEAAALGKEELEIPY